MTNNATDPDWDVVVIGGGVGGLSAALTLGRSRRRVLVIDAGSPRNRFAAHMHGVLGFDGADPRELLAAGRREAAGYGVRIVRGSAATVTETAGGLLVTDEAGATYRCRAAIVASGVSDMLPEIAGLAEGWGRDVLHCPYCHGWEVRDQRLGVIVTSPLGLHFSQLVRQWSDRLTVFTSGAGPVPTATRRRLTSRGITLVDSPPVELIVQDDRLTGVRTADGATVALDAVFVPASSRAHDEFLDGLQLARTETPQGTFLAVDPTGRTSHDRIWAVGNVTNPAANVPVSIAAGSLAAATVNLMLVEEDFDAASDQPSLAAARTPQLTGQTGH